MKKIFLMMLVLTMVIGSSAAQATDMGVQIIGESETTTESNGQGLFSDIIKEAIEDEPKPLPSFSIYSKLPYSKITENDDRITYTYNDISMDVFEGFGIYLEDENYSIWSQDIVDSTYFFEIGAKQQYNEGVSSVGTESEDISFVIEYDTKSSKLNMIYPTSATIQEFAFLNELPYAASAENIYTDSTTDHFGNTYVYSLAVDSGSISVPINGKFTIFAGTIAYRGERSYHSNTKSAAFVVYGDGKKLYESPDIEIGTYPVDFMINVEDCQVVNIEWSCKGTNIWSNWGYEATIYNGIFY